MVSNIEFSEESRTDSHFRSYTILGKPQTPKILRLLIKTGIIKTEKTAGHFLLVVIIICVAISLFMLRYAFLPTPTTTDQGNGLFEVYQEDITPDMRKEYSEAILNKLPSKNAQN
jgi:hypothetical protein